MRNVEKDFGFLQSHGIALIQGLNCTWGCITMQAQHNFLRYFKERIKDPWVFVGKEGTTFLSFAIIANMEYTINA